MVAEVRHDLLRDDQIYNDTRLPTPIHDSRLPTQEMTSNAAQQQLSADILQLLTEALDDFDEQPSRFHQHKVYQSSIIENRLATNNRPGGASTTAGAGVTSRTKESMENSPHPTYNDSYSADEARSSLNAETQKPTHDDNPCRELLRVPEAEPVKPQ